MSLLDYLTAQAGGGSPYGMLYGGPQPFQIPDVALPMAQPQAAPAAPADSQPPPPGLLYYPSPVMGQPQGQTLAIPGGDIGINPQITENPDPFGPVPKIQAPAAPSGFGSGATPFAFAGPGSMSGINPSMLTTQPQGSPAVAAHDQATATDVSAVKRSAPGPVEADDGPDSFVPVGNYKMPMFGEAEDAPQTAAPVASAAPQAAPFSLGGAGAGLGDRLMKGTRGFLGNLASGPIGALAGGIGALVTGQNTDPSSIAAEKTNLTAQALLSKGASPADIKAAANNPALMTALVSQYYGKDKFKIVQTGENDGSKQFSLFNETDGTIKPLASDRSEAGGTITGPNGKQIQIPAGVNRKEFIKRVTEANADAATGKATEAQAKASSFAARMQQAEGILGGLQDQGLSLGNKAAGEVPVVGNYMQSKDYQRYKQAASAFVTAMLRQESGAAINRSEFDRYEKEMFPQPGDAPEVVKQKAAMRSAAIQQMQRAAGPGYQPPGAGGTVNVGGQAINWSVK